MNVVDIAASEVNIETLKAAQEQDESLDKLRGYVTQEREFSTRGNKQYMYSFKDGVLYRTLVEQRGSSQLESRQIVVPTTYRRQVMALAHESFGRRNRIFLFDIFEHVIFVNDNVLCTF